MLCSPHGSFSAFCILEISGVRRRACACFVYFPLEKTECRAAVARTVSTTRVYAGQGHNQLRTFERKVIDVGNKSPTHNHLDRQFRIVDQRPCGRPTARQVKRKECAGRARQATGPACVETDSESHWRLRIGGPFCSRPTSGPSGLRSSSRGTIAKQPGREGTRMPTCQSSPNGVSGQLDAGKKCTSHRRLRRLRQVVASKWEMSWTRRNYLNSAIFDPTWCRRGRALGVAAWRTGTGGERTTAVHIVFCFDQSLAYDNRREMSTKSK